MAGGTTLYDLMKFNIEVPARVVDISGLNELRTINTSAPDEQIFGALARMSDVSAVCGTIDSDTIHKAWRSKRKGRKDD